MLTDNRIIRIIFCDSGLLIGVSFSIVYASLNFKGISIFSTICHHSFLIIIMYNNNNTFAGVCSPEGKNNCNYFRFHPSFARKLHSCLKFTQTKSPMMLWCCAVFASLVNIFHMVVFRGTNEMLYRSLSIHKYI